MIAAPPTSDLWAHQQAALDFAGGKPAVMLDMAMGTGKSRVALEIIRERACGRTLILCPLSVCNVWPEQIRRHLPDWQYVHVLTGTTGAKAVQVSINIGHQIVICNYDAVWRSPLAEAILNQHWDCVILDESHRVKAVPTYRRLRIPSDGAPSAWRPRDITSGKAAAFVHALADIVKPETRLCLSGTPMGQSPLDIWSQYRFLEPSIFGLSYWRFFDRYAVRGGFQMKEVVRYRDLEVLRAAYYRIAYHCEADTLSLPPALHERREVALKPATERAYLSMVRDLQVKMNEHVLTAKNGAVQFLRLQQLASGILAGDERGDAEFIGNEKILALEELLEDIGRDEKVVVFCQFRGDLARLAGVAERTGRVYGEISGSDKSALDSTAQLAAECTLAGVQLQSGGVGIDLSRARYAVYLSPGLSLSNYEQSLARLHRPGQERPVTYYHLVAAHTVDGRLYKALQEKRDLIDATIGAIR